MSGAEASSYATKCRKIFKSDDCEEEITLTNIKNDFVDGLGSTEEDLIIRQYLTMEPSYEISNQVTIENVDFVMYIFGATGAWFRFYFLMINPVILIDMFSKKNIVGEETVPQQNVQPVPDERL